MKTSALLVARLVIVGLVVSLVAFWLLDQTPGDPAQRRAGFTATDERVEADRSTGTGDPDRAVQETGQGADPIEPADGDRRLEYRGSGSPLPRPNLLVDHSTPVGCQAEGAGRDVVGDRRAEPAGGIGSMNRRL